MSTLDGVKGWHTPGASGTGDVGSEWIFTFADHPEFASEVVTIAPNFVRSHFDRSTVFELGDPPPDVVIRSEEELTAEMAALIREAPRTWKEVLQHFIGQPYRNVYGAFSNLRHQLGRCDDEPWYRYTFSDTDFAVEATEPPLSSFDPRHRS